MLERIIREIRRRTRLVGNFPDGKSAVMLVAARLRHIAGTRWGKRVYLDMERLREIPRAGEPLASRAQHRGESNSMRQLSPAAARDLGDSSRGPLALPDQEMPKTSLRSLTDTHNRPFVKVHWLRFRIEGLRQLGALPRFRSPDCFIEQPVFRPVWRAARPFGDLSSGDLQHTIEKGIPDAAMRCRRESNDRRTRGNNSAYGRT